MHSYWWPSDQWDGGQKQLPVAGSRSAPARDLAVLWRALLPLSLSVVQQTFQSEDVLSLSLSLILHLLRECGWLKRTRARPINSLLMLARLPEVTPATLPHHLRPPPTPHPWQTPPTLGTRPTCTPTTMSLECLSMGATTTPVTVLSFSTRWPRSSLWRPQLPIHHLLRAQRPHPSQRWNLPSMFPRLLRPRSLWKCQSPPLLWRQYWIEVPLM